VALTRRLQKLTSDLAEGSTDRAALQAELLAVHQLAERLDVQLDLEGVRPIFEGLVREQLELLRVPGLHRDPAFELVELVDLGERLGLNLDLWHAQNFVWQLVASPDAPAFERDTLDRIAQRLAFEPGVLEERARRVLAAAPKGAQAPGRRWAPPRQETVCRREGRLRVAAGAGAGAAAAGSTAGAGAAGAGAAAGSAAGAGAAGAGAAAAPGRCRRSGGAGAAAGSGAGAGGAAGAAAGSGGVRRRGPPARKPAPGRGRVRRGRGGVGPSEGGDDDVLAGLVLAAATATASEAQRARVAGEATISEMERSTASENTSRRAGRQHRALLAVGERGGAGAGGVRKLLGLGQRLAPGAAQLLGQGLLEALLVGDVHLGRALDPDGGLGPDGHGGGVERALGALEAPGHADDVDARRGRELEGEREGAVGPGLEVVAVHRAVGLEQLEPRPGRLVEPAGERELGAGLDLAGQPGEGHRARHDDGRPEAPVAHGVRQLGHAHVQRPADGSQRVDEGAEVLGRGEPIVVLDGGGLPAGADVGDAGLEQQASASEGSTSVASARRLTSILAA
jgi:hypothetical protein